MHATARVSGVLVSQADIRASSPGTERRVGKPPEPLSGLSLHPPREFAEEPVLNSIHTIGVGKLDFLNGLPLLIR